MKKVLKYIRGVLSSNSSDSSKRFIALLVVVVMIVIAFIDQLFQKHITDFIYNGLLTVVLGALGVIGVENTMSAFKEMKKLGIKLPGGGLPDPVADDSDDNQPNQQPN